MHKLACNDQRVNVKVVNILSFGNVETLASQLIVNNQQFTQSQRAVWHLTQTFGAIVTSLLTDEQTRTWTYLGIVTVDFREPVPSEKKQYCDLSLP